MTFSSLYYLLTHSYLKDVTLLNNPFGVTQEKILFATLGTRVTRWRTYTHLNKLCVDITPRGEQERKRLKLSKEEIQGSLNCFVKVFAQGRCGIVVLYATNDVREEAMVVFKL